MGDNYAVSKLSVEVADYLLLDDPSYYQSHVFVLQVWIEQDLYEIQRSYVAFVELDNQLRRKYPRSKLPVLPLAGAKDKVFQGNNKSAKSTRFSILKIGQKEGNNKEPMVSRQSFGTETTRDSESHQHPVGAYNKKKLTKRIDTHEVIGQKKTPLTYYLGDLLKIPEVLMSSTLLYFLDEESVDGDLIEELEDSTEQQEHKLILEDEPKVFKTVRKDFKLSLSVEPSDVVVWCFETKHRDIAFCVWFNEQEVDEYPFQRYNAQEYKIFGLFEVTAKGKLELQWDNSYSKFHSKTLVFSYKIIDKSVLVQMQQKAKEIQVSKHEFSQKRKHLFRILQKVSTEVLQTSGCGGDEVIDDGVVRDESVHLDTEYFDDHNNDNDNDGEVGVDTGTGPVDLDENINSMLLLKGSPTKLIKELQEQLVRLKNEKQFVQIAYTQCETALVAERR
jgi:hypothetical protein